MSIKKIKNYKDLISDLKLLVNEADEFDADEFDGNEEEESFEETAKHLCYLVRKLLSNQLPNIDTDVDYNNDGLEVYFFLQRREKIEALVKIFECAYKLKKETLPQYISEAELYESKEGYPVFLFTFLVDE
jgi:hypothetical protein